MKINKTFFRKIFRHYIEKMGGAVLLVSNDSCFSRVTKACFKIANLSENSYIYTKEFPNLFKTINSILSERNHVTVLIEKYLEGRISIDDIGPLQEKYKSKIKVIVVTSETDSNTIALIYERGADNVIIKPASFDTITEKIASTLSPNNEFDELIDSCKTALLLSDLDLAEELANKILKIRPGSATGLMLKGDIYLRRKDFNKSETFYVKAVLYTKLYLDPLKRLVNFYDITGNVKRKIVYLTKLDNMSPLNRERKLLLANSYLSIADNKSAYKYFEQAVKLAKKEASAVLSKTYMDISLSLKEIDSNKSIEYSTHAIHAMRHNLSKDDVWMFNEKGIALRKCKKNKEAILVFLQALKISPDDSVLNYNLAMAYAEEDEVKLASKFFSKALIHDNAIADGSASISYNIGLTFYNDRKFDDAYAMFQKATKLDPQNMSFVVMLEKSYEKTTDHDIKNYSSF